MLRRSFIGSILAASMAPAIVKANILMPIKKIVLPDSLPIVNGGTGCNYLNEINKLQSLRFFGNVVLLTPASNHLPGSYFNVTDCFTGKSKTFVCSNQSTWEEMIFN